MTVGAGYLTLFDFREDVGPRTVGERLPNSEAFVPQVVEVQYDRIGLAAIDTGVGSEVFDEPDHALEPHLTPSGAVYLDIPRLVPLVVLLAVLRAARTAIRVALSCLRPLHGEVIQRLHLAASGTALHLTILRGPSDNRSEAPLGVSFSNLSWWP